MNYKISTLVLLITSVCSMSAQQYWEITSGPPASTNCLATNSQGHVFSGTSSSAVYRTTNLGNSWTRHDNGIDDGGPNFVTVNQMVVGAGDELFAAVNGKGIFRSRDNGETWQILNLGVVVPSNARLSISRKINAAGTATELFVGQDAGPSNLAMYMSENSGESFVTIPKSNLPGAVSSLFETFLSPNSNKLFVLVSYNKGLYRSSNRGTSWTRIDSDPSSGESDDNFKTMTHDVNGHLYVGRNALPASTKSKNAVVMKSTNDGESWFYLIDGWQNDDITNNRVSGIAIADDGEMYATTEKSGTFYSTNFGETWVARNEGLDGDGSASSVVITNRRHAFVSPLGAFVHRHIDPTMSVNEADIVGMQLGRAVPNPVVNAVRLPITVLDATLVSLQVVNATGMEVLDRREFTVERGEHWVNLDASLLAPGVYQLRMVAGNVVRATQFVVTR